MLSDELNHPKVLISYSHDSAEHELIHRFGEKRSQSLNAAPSLCIKQAPLATHEELSSDPCMSQNKTSVKPLASHHLQDAPTRPTRYYRHICPPRNLIQRHVQRVLDLRIILTLVHLQQLPHCLLIHCQFP